MQTVMIVDDWPLLRWRLGEALTRAGCLTLAAETAREALALLRATRVDLIIARERLADIEGSTLAEIVRRRGHGHVVILLLTEEPAAARRALAGGMVDAVMPRELDVEPVVTLVRGLLPPRILPVPATIDLPHRPAPKPSFRA